MKVHEHAENAAASRNIPIKDVVDAVNDRFIEQNLMLDATTDAAVLVGFAENAGWKGFSNGNVVWAVIRNGELKTVMFRREDQPSTPVALRVRTVIA